MTFVRYLYYIFMPYITYIMVQHEGCILLMLTNFDFLTNHSSMKLSSSLQFERNVYTINLDYLTKTHITLKLFSYQIQFHEIPLHSAKKRE